MYFQYGRIIKKGTTNFKLYTAINLLAAINKLPCVSFQILKFILLIIVIVTNTEQE